MDRKARKSVVFFYSDYLSKNKQNFVEACEWANGEGLDLTADDKPVMSLTWSEFEAVVAAGMALKVGEDK